MLVLANGACRGPGTTTYPVKRPKEPYASSSAVVSNCEAVSRDRNQNKRGDSYLNQADQGVATRILRASQAQATNQRSIHSTK